MAILMENNPPLNPENKQPAESKILLAGFVVKYTEIYFIESVKNNLFVYTQNYGVLIHRSSLSSFHNQLPQNSFFRINRKHSINLQHLESFIGFEVTMSCTYKLSNPRVAIKRKANFVKALEHFYKPNNIHP